MSLAQCVLRDRPVLLLSVFLHRGAGRWQVGNPKDTCGMALKFSPGFEVQRPVIKQVSPVLHTGDRWETIWYWASSVQKGWRPCGFLGARGWAKGTASYGERDTWGYKEKQGERAVLCETIKPCVIHVSNADQESMSTSTY